MRIVSWNCCGKLREKFSIISGLDADIYVIQECENPKTVDDASFQSFASNYVWQGDIKYKGLGIFAKSKIIIENQPWNNHLLRHFIPVKVDNDFILLAVWACHPYIEEYAIYQDIHYKKYDKNMVIAGDFNSNKIFDSKYSILAQRSHSAVVKKLKQKGLTSAYHAISGDEQGQEIKSTFYLYKNKEKKHHIDYFFVDKDKIKDFNVLESDFWLKYSDHFPLVLNIKG